MCLTQNQLRYLKKEIKESLFQGLFVKLTIATCFFFRRILMKIQAYSIISFFLLNFDLAHRYVFYLSLSLSPTSSSCLRPSPATPSPLSLLFSTGELRMHECNSTCRYEILVSDENLNSRHGGISASFKKTFYAMLRDLFWMKSPGCFPCLNFNHGLCRQRNIFHFSSFKIH